ncbi:uncharacterized protein LOC122858472 [Aphidius gifuensis]|uniref:uncharacterized protein LOC122858472 n=1 Tax=Aphidius gifuensis TaxID=684658 RepID=UPI001CDC3408|nr:uncharacterized protein LOC122858472 [Aphidius gifuensis]XP_044017333.1 uncharacterized protein LOC122858472 [Aphidius gifuensis]
MESNPRKKRKMETEFTEQEARRMFWTASQRYEYDKINFINMGTDIIRLLSNDDYIEDIVNNNYYNSNKLSLQKAIKYPRFSVFNMKRLIASDPRLEKICIDGRNNFFYSSYVSYTFNKGKAHSDKKLHEKVDDFKYLINLYGSHLKVLNVEEYPFSEIMPLINTNCPNLNELILQFKKIESQDFENVFSNMSHLEVLRINWQCEDLNLPLTLVESLEQVGGTLKELCLSRNQNQDHLCLPDSLASVFLQLITLEKLNIIYFEPSQLLLQSISKMKNLVHLRFMCSWLNNDPVFDEKINMYPIGNLQNLETLYINFDCGVTDEFLINLSNNAKKLRHLDIIGKNITDNGMIALNNLKELESLKFNLNELEENNFITDKSIECLINEKLEYLNISNFTKITNRSMVKLFENLPNLTTLYVRNTNITIEVARELSKLTLCHKKAIFVYVSFEDRDNVFKSFALTDFFFKSNFNTCKYIDILI